MNPFPPSICPGATLSGVPPMTPNRRDYTLSPVQPILQRKRKRSLANRAPRSESDFWKFLDVEKLCVVPHPVRKRAAA